MPKLTLLNMTQNILSEMDSDEVNGIADTVESTQVAHIIETMYYDLTANRSIPEHREIFQLTALGLTTQPNYLQYPSTATNISWFKYDNRESSSSTSINYMTIDYVEPTTFIEMLNSRDNDDTDTTSISDPSGIKLLIKTNSNPTYWTSFDDDYIICDSYDSSIESTLQSSKTQAYGTIEPVFTQSNTFIPDLDVDLFPLLLSASKSACFASIKQQGAPVAQAAARSHIVKGQNNRHRLNIANTYGQPNYGRK